MKIRFLLSISVLILLAAFSSPRKPVISGVKNESFARGEELNFKMNFGVFTVGKCTANVQPYNFNYNDRSCYKIDIVARTVGVVNWISDIENEYSSYVDTFSLLPQMFYRKQREGRYLVEEQTDFDQANKKITVKTIDRKTGLWKKPVFFDAPSQVRDMISGFFYLRTLDLSTLGVNDTVSIPGFFEDEFYELKIIYKGKKVIKTDVGRLNTLVFKPVMPKNSVFDGREAITVYFSDDKNQVPIKIDSRMFIGRAGMELVSYSGLLHPLNMAGFK